MRTITVLVGLLLSTSPAWAQSRVYTNADLSAHPVTWRSSVTPEQLAGLEARQFRGSPVQDWGPQVVIVDSSSTDGPFGAFAAFSPSYVAPGGVSFETVGPAYYGGNGYGYRLRGRVWLRLWHRAMGRDTRARACPTAGDGATRRRSIAAGHTRSGPDAAGHHARAIAAAGRTAAAGLTCPVTLVARYADQGPPRGRGIPAGGVAPPSNTPVLSVVAALPSGRRAPRVWSLFSVNGPLKLTIFSSRLWFCGRLRVVRTLRASGALCARSPCRRDTNIQGGTLHTRRRDRRRLETAHPHPSV